MKKNTFLLKLNSKENLKYLERAGYENVQNITFENLRVKIVVVDDFEKTIMPISVTCLAAINQKPLNFEEFRVINEVNNSCEDLEC